MVNRGITGKDFETLAYGNLPLDRLLKEYPKGIAPPRIFSRLQNLEKQLDEMEGEQAVLSKKSRLRETSQLFDWTKKREEAKRDEILGFQRNYAKELEVIYSQINPRLVDQDFAKQRLTRPGKSSRIAETVLIAEHKVIHPEELFGLGHLDAVDRIQLAKAKFESGEYIVPLRVLINYVEALPQKMRASPQSVPELLYEFNSLYALAVERTSEGPDKNI